MSLVSFRGTLRRLAQSPGFALAVVLTLALSIGANTAVFSLVNALLMRPLPYPQPNRLAGIEMVSNQDAPDPSTAIDGETWEMIRDQVPQVIAAVSSLGAPAGNATNIRTPAGVRNVSSLRVSAGFFDVLGELPVMGRTFTPDEDRDGGPHAVIISNPLWRTSFQSDPHILGRAILVKGEPYTVVGLLSPRFTLPGAADIYTPIRPSRSGEGGGTNYSFMARLKPGATWQEANAALARLHPKMLDWHEHDLRPGEHRELQFIPLEQHLSASEHDPALALLLATGFIVLIACANLASLTLVRMRRRAYELATRLALGAGRGALIQQMWAESAVLAIIGGIVGLVTAIALLRALVALLPPQIVPFGGVALDGRVLLFTVVISIGTSLLFGMLPALTIFRMDPASVLGQRAIASARGSHARQVLIACEVALTVVLLAGSGLLIRSLIHLQNLPPGFDAHGVLTAQASLDQASYHDPARFAALMRESVAAMKRIAGVTHAAVGLSLPYQRGLNNGVTVKDGKQAGRHFMTSEVYITPAFFDALGIRLRGGRAFSDSDTAASQPVAIVNESFARQILHDPNPVGRMLGDDKAAMRIIGVVNDVQAKPGLDDTGPISPERTLYIPATQVPSDFLALVHVWFQPSWIIRSTHLDAQTPRAMQQALAAVDPNLPFASFHTMDELLSTALAQQRVEVALLSSLAVLALLLAALGIFALVSSVVTDRQREFGIRLALGSPISDSMLVAGRSGALPALVGLAAGLALAFVTLRAMKSALFGISSYDPVTLAATVVALMGLAALASLLPALRIARIEPAVVLRAE
ncbi:MAG TPA: ADOP family duplicated permease [Acidobacteriaceae bacterium]